MESSFLSAAEPYVDPHYAQKVWKQGQELRSEDRKEFLRKADLFVLWAKSGDPRAGKIFHEISGLVSDRGPMREVLTPNEIQRRKEWAEETGQKEWN